MAFKALMKGFKKAKSIVYEHNEVNPFYGKFIVSPFERGYGTTIGNTLRRILLSSLQGHAITAIRIKAWDIKKSEYITISNEFDAIPGVLEDTTDIILNLKKIILSLPEETESRVVTIEKKGPCIIKAEDIAVDDTITVINTDQQILTLSEGSEIQLDLQIDFGRGYISAERNAEYINEINVIAIDSIFTPIARVKYDVENTRVGERTDYDKLVLEIWTNGTIKPEDALACASKIAKDHFITFVNFEEEPEEEEEDIDEEADRLHSLLETPIEELELSVRSSNCLRNSNIRTIGDLVKKTEEEISKTKNFGKKSLMEIKEKLKQYNLTLGMKDIEYNNSR